MLQQSQRYSSTVLTGDQTGRQITYPTINLDPLIVPNHLQRGVYASKVWIDGELFQGALYFGPRLVKNEEHDVLEIFLLDFSGELYNKEVEFTMEKFIRGVMSFGNLEDMREQIDQDIKAIKEVL